VRRAAAAVRCATQAPRSSAAKRRAGASDKLSSSFFGIVFFLFFSFSFFYKRHNIGIIGLMARTGCRQVADAGRAAAPSKAYMVEIVDKMLNAFFFRYTCCCAQNRRLLLFSARQV